MASDFVLGALQNLFPDLAIDGRSTVADQAFQRKLSAIDYKIQRESLQREDIRDLVELTVGRMDIYHVVGTLLLTFCVTWYSDNSLIKSDLPSWFVTFFLISNFCAVGYLLFSVWLAMHASIAGHSIGVRLLTSYARLSIPSRKELDQISVPLVPLIGQLLSMGKKTLTGMKESLHEARASVKVESRFSGHLGKSLPSNAKPGTSTSITGSEAPGEATAHPVEPTFEAAKEDDDSDDDQEHFRVFMEEQKRWLTYDACARVCMCLGVNQMLQALSYFIVGVIGDNQPSAAVFSFFAIKWLSVLLLRLDMGEAENSTKERCALFCFLMLPPLFAAFLLFVLTWKTPAESLIATPIYCLHAGWLIYAIREMLPHSPSSGVLPTRLRTVYYLNVIEHKQLDMARAVRIQQQWPHIESLKQAREQLQSHIQEVMQNEAATGCVSKAGRRGTELDALRRTVERRLERLSGCTAIESNPGASSQVNLARQTLEHLAIWERAPDIFAMLESLRNQEVKSWLEKDQQGSIDESYEAFRQCCKDLKLGIWMSTAAGKDPDEHGPLAVSPGEEPAVRVDAYQDSAPMSVWIDPKSDVLIHEPPPSDNSTSFAGALHVDLAEWRAAAANVRSTAQAEENEQPSTTVIPPEASPPDQLPIKTVRRFTFGTVAWWILAMCMHIISQSVALYNSSPHSTMRISTKAVNAAWPEPAGFFQISALSCNESNLLIFDSAFVYKAERLPQGNLAKIQELGHKQAVTVICRANFCHALDLSVKGRWSLTPLDADMKLARQQMLLPLPQESLHGVVAAWAECSTKECQSMWVVGWNGLDAVIVCKLHARRPDEWALVRRFKLTPSIGHCESTRTKCSTADAIYGNVQALQVASNSQALLVLTHGNMVDGWHLGIGRFLGRWHLPKQHMYSTMCYDGQTLMLSRLGKMGSGPILETAPAPGALVEQTQVQNRTGCSGSTQQNVDALEGVSPGNDSLLI